jgi:hypothetical protein
MRWTHYLSILLQFLKSKHEKIEEEDQMNLDDSIRHYMFRQSDTFIYDAPNDVASEKRIDGEDNFIKLFNRCVEKIESLDIKILRIYKFITNYKGDLGSTLCYDGVVFKLYCKIYDKYMLIVFEDDSDPSFLDATAILSSDPNNTLVELSCEHIK